MASETETPVVELDEGVAQGVPDGPIDGYGEVILGRCYYVMPGRGRLRWSQMTPWQLREGYKRLADLGHPYPADLMQRLSAYRDAHPQSILTQYNPPAAASSVG